MENDFPVISLEEPLLPEIVANHLIEYIQQNHLKANDRLPNELDLARSFGVSRGTVRSAIALLKSRNIVVRKRGSGTYIAENTGQIDDPFGLSFAQDKCETVQRLTETRGVLEPGITALAAERASDEDISEMIRLAELVEECIRSKTEHIEYDQQFHLQIARSTKNPLLFQLLQQTLKESMPLLGREGGLPVEDTLNRAIEAHRKIIRAIQEKNPEKAYSAMLEHHRIAADMVKNHFGAMFT